MGTSTRFDFPAYWQAILESVTSLVTVIMLFAIQHLQARDQVVTHRKLDEILPADAAGRQSPDRVEEAPDEELEVLTDLNRHTRLNNHTQ